MKTFKQFIREYSFDSPPPVRSGVNLKKGITQTKVMGGTGMRGNVIRSDPRPLPNKIIPRNYVTDASPNLTNQNIKSGAAPATKAPEPGFHKMKGLYADRGPKTVEPYSGIDRDEPRAWNNKKLYLNKGAKADEPTTTTVFRRDRFKKLATGELFANDPGKEVGHITTQHGSQTRGHRQEKRVPDVAKFTSRARRRGIDIEGENV
jgi:hypothetical protein